MGNKLSMLSFAEKERMCEYRFSQLGPVWHLATNGTKEEIIFTNDDEFRFGVTLMAICAFILHVKIFAFAVMDNHIHVIMNCSEVECRRFLELYRTKLARFLASKGRTVNLTQFDGDPIPITDLKMLRNEIVYVNRNGYVALVSATPYSYRWSTGRDYFSDRTDNLFAVLFNSLPYDDRRRILHSRILQLPDNYLFARGMMVASSFCDIVEGEGFFRDAHHYFNLLTRDYEAYCAEARRYGDSVAVTDDELYSAILTYCRNKYAARFPTDLRQGDKVEVARVMRQTYKANNGQIQRILGLSIAVVNEMFPLTAKK